MAEFQELIKNFERIRDYMRQFFVCGYKVRSDYDAKSARTYDTERRRIESLLNGYTHSAYTPKGKKVYITVDSKTISLNPLYAAWKSKSFTDNDICLHFLLPRLLADHREGFSARDAAEEISLRYGLPFEDQTVRLKLKEYEALGIFRSHQKGRELIYTLADPLPLEHTGLWQHLLEAVTFYQGAAPFGFIGSTLMDRENRENELFQFKHQFIMHTLEDGILLDILTAIKEQRGIQFENHSRKNVLSSTVSGVPLQIFVSTHTGRRYLCLYLPECRRFRCFRLDCISRVKFTAHIVHYEQLRMKLERNLPHCFGVSFGGYNRMEELQVRLHINEKTEKHILERLEREGRGGEITRIRENEYLYSGSFYDTNEILPWLKTFTGQILDIQGSNSACIHKITGDWEQMYQMYCSQESAGTEKSASSPEAAADTV